MSDLSDDEMIALSVPKKKDIALDQMHQWFMAVQAQQNMLREPISIRNEQGLEEIAQPGDYIVQQKDVLTVVPRAEFEKVFVSGDDIDDRWHQHFYYKMLNSRLLDFVTWKGVPVVKLPLDLIIYQEIIWNTKPQLIIETGTALGGSALFFADMMGKWGRVFTIDLASQVDEPDRRVTYFLGDSTDPKTVARAQKETQGSQRVMCVLDSHHGADHVFAEMELYAPLVTKGQYLVVEDSNVGGHPVENTMADGGGPWEAITRYLEAHPGEFAIDGHCERFGVTYNPRGWLLKR